MATFAIAAAIVVLAAWLILGGITVAGYLLAARDADKPEPPPTSVDEHFKTAPTEKLIYAGSDLDGDLPTGMLTELYEAIDAYKRGEFIEADAPREPS
jgi:hypothetical protein